MNKSIVLDKSIAFALRIVHLYKHLTNEKKEYVLSKQVLLSGAFIAKFVKAATQAEDRTGFVSSMNTGMQRASETEFWLLLLREGGYMYEAGHKSVNEDCVELINILASIEKTAKANV